MFARQRNTCESQRDLRKKMWKYDDNAITQYITAKIPLPYLNDFLKVFIRLIKINDEYWIKSDFMSTTAVFIYNNLRRVVSPCFVFWVRRRQTE